MKIRQVIENRAQKAGPPMDNLWLFFKENSPQIIKYSVSLKPSMGSITVLPIKTIIVWYSPLKYLFIYL